MSARVVYDHQGSPVTLTEVGPIDPPRRVDHSACDPHECWVCLWHRQVAADLDQHMVACPACSGAIAMAGLCEHDDPVCPGCCPAEHLDPPRLWVVA